MLCCNARYFGQRVSGGDAPACGKISCRKSIIFSLLYLLGLVSWYRTCQNQMVCPAQKHAAWLERFLALLDWQKEKKWENMANPSPSHSFSFTLTGTRGPFCAFQPHTNIWMCMNTFNPLWYQGHYFVPSITFKCSIAPQCDKCHIASHPKTPPLLPHTGTESAFCACFQLLNSNR